MKRNKAVILAVILAIGLSGCNSRKEKDRLEIAEVK